MILNYIKSCSTLQHLTAPCSLAARTILDGGALVHCLPWKIRSTFASILESYSDYVIKKYGKAVIVFDGYCGASTKDMTHRQRTRGKKGPTVSFTKEMCLTVSKELFLNAPQNSA